MDNTRHTNNCELCYRDLTIKRTATLECSHVFHRSCFLSWCECGSSVGEKTAEMCPTCRVPCIGTARNMNNQLLPIIVGFGPTAQPSPFFLATSLNTKGANFDATLSSLLVVTAEWLVDASKDLEAGMASGQNAEYLMDIFEEINKIINRLKIIIQQLERYKQIQDSNILNAERIDEVYPQRNMEDIVKTADSLLTIVKSHEVTTNIVHKQETIIELEVSMNRYETLVKNLSDAVLKNSKQQGTENSIGPHDVTMDIMASTSDDEEVCSICLDALSTKRSLSLDKCLHKYHVTCGMRWFEEKLGIVCCVCREVSIRSYGKDGVDIPFTFPFERVPKGEDDMLTISSLHRDVIIDAFSILVEQKRSALKDGKLMEYVKDIEDEMKTLEKRIIHGDAQ
ncbi:hypothetical protein PRIPAC_84680 [Pristionchus pacificus]|uniref:Zinc finger protein n=1 Tax=Pristionchus pacificus TaxID=54126 RepID=A0A2A6BMI0_PRIPA|nr:hypothetical protein PRIPAC_84680 [Pristionchus pacificus]|eukprot:PDM67110.1 zinc finger protein [Pristionchus pacificus]